MNTTKYCAHPYDMQPRDKKKRCITYEQVKKEQDAHGIKFQDLNLRRRRYLEGRLISSFNCNIIETEVRGELKKIDPQIILDITRDTYKIEGKIVPKDSTALKFALERIDRISEGDNKLLLTITQIFNQTIGNDLFWCVSDSIDAVKTGFLPSETTSKRYYDLYKKNGCVYIEGHIEGTIRDLNKNAKILPIKFSATVRYNLNTDKAFHAIRFKI